MTGNCGIITGDGGIKELEETIKALEAFSYSGCLFLTPKQRKRCFQNPEGVKNFALARKLSRQTFHKLYPDYVKRCKNSYKTIIAEKRVEMFNVFSEEDLKVMESDGD